MRKLRVSLAALLFLLTAGTAPSRGSADSEYPAQQVLFVGDRACGDNPTDCAFESFVPAHPFLHVVVHDQPGNAAWAVWKGTTCDGPTTELAGGEPVASSGFQEVVANLVPGSPSGSPACLLFRGGYGRSVTYYAAYTDDTPTLDAPTVLPNYRAMGGRPDEGDVDVTYIHRDPSYDFDARPNTPRVGQLVTYTAHVVNAGGRPELPISFTWFWDGKPVSSGQSSSPLLPFAEQTYSLTEPWDPEDHRLTFRTSTTSPQLSTDNDSLTIDTAAVSLGFWVERSAYTYFRSYQLRYCTVQGCSGSDSLEDWLQRQVAAWNGILRGAAYPGIDPAGIHMRVRVDKIVIVPDGALPLHGGIASDDPDKLDRSVDLQWGLPSAGVQQAYPLAQIGPFRVDWALLHELGHARSLADLYRFDIPVSGGSTFDIAAIDRQAVFDPADPFSVTAHLRAFTGTDGGTLLYQNEERDLMACVCSDYYSAYTAIVLNRLGDRRAKCGNYNAPCNIGDWYLDLPPRNLLRIAAAARRNLAVRAFFDTSNTYDVHAFSQTESVPLKRVGSDFELPADPFDDRGSVERAGHNLLLLEISDSVGLDRFCFMEPTAFNLAYWQGYTSPALPAVFTVHLALIHDNDCELSQPPVRVNEPFATSVARSGVTVSAVTSTRTAPHRLVTVRLVDPLGNPMRDRLVRVSAGSDRPLAQGYTGAGGLFTVNAPSAKGAIHVDDVTDDLTLAPGS